MAVSNPFSRRTFLRSVATLPLALPWALATRQALAQSKIAPVLRARDPENYEFPFDLASFFTPSDRFFVSSTFGVARLDRGSWRMQVEGAVTRPFELTYEDLLKMPTRTVAAVLEDPGNNRALLSPPERGIPWGLGAVGCARWTGVPLSEVLNRAGLRPEGVEVVFEGADAGEIKDEPRSPGKVNYARSIPLKKALGSDVLLAYKINNEDLPSHLGGPVRLVVPGWYGCAWVKWLQRLVVTGAPFEGYFQKFDCSIWERRSGFATLAPVTELQVKAQIARPVMYEKVKTKNVYPVFGAAWTGESEITAVDVSSDEGKTWQSARLLDSPGGSGPFAWKFWDFQWAPPKGGRYNLMARATDARGRVQPTQRDADRRSWMISHVISTPVDVAD